MNCGFHMETKKTNKYNNYFTGRHARKMKANNIPQILTVPQRGNPSAFL